MSVNFIDFIVAPLLSPLVRVYQPLMPLAVNLADNRKTWAERVVEKADKSLDRAKATADKATLVQRGLQFQKLFPNMYVSSSPTNTGASAAPAASSDKGASS